MPEKGFVLHRILLRLFPRNLLFKDYNRWLFVYFLTTVSESRVSVLLVLLVLVEQWSGVRGGGGGGCGVYGW